MKPQPIEFEAMMNVVRTKRDHLKNIGDLIVIGSKMNDHAPDDYEEVQYVGFKNVTVLLTLKVIDSRVSVETNILAGKGIQDVLEELNKDGRVSFDASDYFGTIEVSI